MLQGVMKGWLLKRGKRLLSRWRCRFFVLKSNGDLAYYTDESCGQLLGVCSLGDAVRLLSVDVRNDSDFKGALREVTTKHSSRAFKIVSKARVWCFVPMKDSVDQWLSQLTPFIPGGNGRAALVPSISGYLAQFNLRSKKWELCFAALCSPSLFLFNDKKGFSAFFAEEQARAVGQLPNSHRSSHLLEILPLSGASVVKAGCSHADSHILSLLRRLDTEDSGVSEAAGETESFISVLTQQKKSVQFLAKNSSAAHRWEQALKNVHCEDTSLSSTAEVSNKALPLLASLETLLSSCATSREHTRAFRRFANSESPLLDLAVRIAEWRAFAQINSADPIVKKEAASLCAKLKDELEEACSALDDGGVITVESFDDVCNLLLEAIATDLSKKGVCQVLQNLEFMPPPLPHLAPMSPLPGSLLVSPTLQTVLHDDEFDALFQEPDELSGDRLLQALQDQRVCTRIIEQLQDHCDARLCARFVRELYSVQKLEYTQFRRRRCVDLYRKFVSIVNAECLPLNSAQLHSTRIALLCADSSPFDVAARAAQACVEKALADQPAEWKAALMTLTSTPLRLDSNCVAPLFPWLKSPTSSTRSVDYAFVMTRSDSDYFVRWSRRIAGATNYFECHSEIERFERTVDEIVGRLGETSIQGHTRVEDLVESIYKTFLLPESPLCVCASDTDLHVLNLFTTFGRYMFQPLKVFVETHVTTVLWPRFQRERKTANRNFVMIKSSKKNNLLVPGLKDPPKFASVLIDARLGRYFRVFVERDCVSFFHELLFFDAVHEYKYMETAEDRYSCAHRIADRFLRSDAPQKLLYVRDEIVSDILQQIDQVSVPRTLLDFAQEQAFTALDANCYCAHFFDSDMYKRMCLHLQRIASPATKRNTVVLGFPKNAEEFESLLLHSQETSLGEQFEAFLRDAYCVENLLFCRRVQQFRDAALAVERRIFVRKIFEDFLSDEAPLHINLPSVVAVQLVNKLEKSAGAPSPSVFDSAQSEILQLMWTDSWARFVSTLQCSG
ncbi:MAG: hypothetical protein MHM6MM_000879 [Cercozoa sp. M6MM]